MKKILGYILMSPMIVLTLIGCYKLIVIIIANIHMPYVREFLIYLGCLMLMIIGIGLILKEE